MVIASGMVTSRTSFSFGSLEATPLSRWVRRRNEATERSRTSSARSAVTNVRRPRCFSPAPRGAGEARRAHALRRVGGRAGLPPLRPRARAGLPARLRGVSSSPKRFLATSPALRLVSSSCLRRSSSSRLRASAASRSLRSTDLAAGAAACLFLGDLAFFGLAHARIGERMGAAHCALPRSACAARRRTASASAPLRLAPHARR